MQSRPDWPEHHFRAMGSAISLWLEADEPSAREAFRLVEKLYAANERALSRFDQASELSRLNAQPGRWVDISPLMSEVLARALALAEETGGLFDPTILPALEAAGYTRSFESIGSGDEVLTVDTPVGVVGQWDKVRIDERRQRAYLPEDTRIDLGGIAKGYTAGQAVDLLSRLGPCLVDAGGDLAAGKAPMGMPGWPVSLTTPWTGDGDMPQHLLMVWLRDASIATSGIDWRRWEHQGRTVHHLIDPRSGAPAETDALTATILDPDPSRAEGWATAALVLGMDSGLTALSTRGLAGALVDAYRRVALTPEMQMHIAWQAA